MEERQREEKEEVQLVSFRLGAEEYGLDIAAVQEIVHLPESINRVPNAPEYVAGVMVLRSRVLPVVSLRTPFRLGDGELDDRARVVVVNLRSAGQGQQGATVGLVVDAVAEVLRVPKTVIDPVPALLRSASEEGISGVCKLAEGKRLVYVLAAERLLASGDLLEVTAMAETGENAEQRGAGTGEEEEQLVTFRLGEEEFAAGITEVREIIRVPEIVTVPRAPHFVEGAINLRGTVIPVIDLRKRFGMTAKSRDEYTRIVVVEMEGVLTGIVVDAVREVIKVPPCQRGGCSGDPSCERGHAFHQGHSQGRRRRAADHRAGRTGSSFLWGKGGAGRI
ncbi:chemotaxis protein CheW [Thermodesulfitimonas sp.]